MTKSGGGGLPRLCQAWGTSAVTGRRAQEAADGRAAGAANSVAASGLPLPATKAAGSTGLLTQLGRSIWGPADGPDALAPGRAGTFAEVVGFAAGFRQQEWSCRRGEWAAGSQQQQDFASGAGWEEVGRSPGQRHSKRGKPASSVEAAVNHTRPARSVLRRGPISPPARILPCPSKRRQAELPSCEPDSCCGLGQSSFSPSSLVAGGRLSGGPPRQAVVE
jgi:hypothetical protein